MAVTYPTLENELRELRRLEVALNNYTQFFPEISSAVNNLKQARMQVEQCKQFGDHRRSRLEAIARAGREASAALKIVP